MKKSKIYTLILVSLTLVLSACSLNTKEDLNQDDAEKLQIVATNSILADMVEEVGGEHVSVHSIVPRGTDPHEYEPLPVDIAKSSDADIIFFNGLNLETGGSGWFLKLMETAQKKENVDYFVASREVEPIYLSSDDGSEEEEDPHAWLSLKNGISYVETIRDVLIEKDPASEKSYEENAANYINKLEKLDEDNLKRYQTIPEDQRVMVTSEGAFKYFAREYGVEPSYIWEINTESQGTPDQLITVIDTVRASNINYLLVEQSVDPRSMETVSRETKLPIYDTIFTDSLGKKDQKGDTYYTMMEWNLDTIYSALTK